MNNNTSQIKSNYTSKESKETNKPKSASAGSSTKPTSNSNSTNKSSSNSNAMVARKDTSASAVESNSEWMENISKQASVLDENIRSFIAERPVAITLAAVGAGLIGSLIVKKLNSSSEAK